MPTASHSFLNHIVQYIGSTTGTYTKGHFYECESVTGGYSWQELEIQDMSGKQDVIDSSHKLSADLVDDSTSTNKFVTSSDKTTWSGKQDALVSGTNIKTINSTSLLGSGNIDVGADIPQQDTAPLNPSEDDLWIDTDEPGSTIAIDSAVSTTSTNPIENQAITNYVNNTIKSKITTLWSGSKNTTGDISLSDSYANYDLIAISIGAPDSNGEQVFFVWGDSIVVNTELNFSVYQKNDIYVSTSCKFKDNTTFNKSIRGIKF